MKKILLVAAVCAASCCLVACGSNVSYEDLSAKLKSDYTSVTVTVTDKFDENTSLTSEYYMSISDEQITVTYEIQKFTEISLEKPSEFIKPLKYSGVAVIKDGVVTQVSGNYDFSNVIQGVLPSGIDFKEEYFENAKITKSSFFADVKDATAFLGTEISCTDMKVSASFGDSFNSITVTYKAAGGNSVEYKYKFEI